MVLRLVSSPLLSLIPRMLRILRVLPAADHVTIEVLSAFAPRSLSDRAWCG
jgi:hypothetical protein